MQVVKLPKGKYVVAVSGGVDSMALLDMLRRQAGLDLIVAHFNHGIRSDASEDQKLVAHYAMSHKLKFVTESANLGEHASEEVARKARYAFLRRYCKQEKAAGIITAHHEDDLVETVVINLLRGTGWRGIAPFMHNQGDIIRPLLNVRKSELVAYAHGHNVPWHDESTNSNQKYLRNYVRHTVIPILEQKNSHWRDEILRLVRNQQTLRRTIEQELDALLRASEEVSEASVNQVHHPSAPYPHAQTIPFGTTARGDMVLRGGWRVPPLPRYVLVMLPTPIAYELLQHALRCAIGNSVQRNLAEAGLLFAKTALPGKVMELGKNCKLRATPRTLVVETSGS